MDSLDTLVHARRDPTPGDSETHPSASAPTSRFARSAPGRPSEPEGKALVLGRYRLLERLGAGGFGVVWRAHDELLHREVAVKRISLGAGGDPIDSERASREALAGARLAHPAIVVLHEACAAEDAFYLISELIHGDTLAELIAADALTDEALLEIGLALAEALAHAHARGVIHRDVKPQNVLVPHEPDERGGVAKLADFGGARLTGEDALTRTGDVLGTLAYMAPEQSEGHEAGEPADLYALALVLYEGLAGVNPVRGATPAATARRIGSLLEPLERRRVDLPRSLTRAIDLALLAEPEQRGELEDLHVALEEALVRGLKRTRRGARRRAKPPPIPGRVFDKEPASSPPNRARGAPTRKALAGVSGLGTVRTRRTEKGKSLDRTCRDASHCHARCGWVAPSRRSSGCSRRAAPALRCCYLPQPLRWSCCPAAPGSAGSRPRWLRRSARWAWQPRFPRSPASARVWPSGLRSARSATGG